jgi:hypothetical protein
LVLSRSAFCFESRRFSNPEVVEENNVEEDATEIATEIEDVEAVECPEEVDENNGEVE